MTQGILFKEYLDPLKLKEGKTKCPCCSKLMRAYAKTLDKRLVKQAWDILIWLQVNHRKVFMPSEIFPDDRKYDCNKLHYWEIIKQADKFGWFFTKKGYDFLMGKIQLPKKVWVFNNKVIDEEDVLMVTVDNADERWQTCRADYSQDYVPYKYETAPKL